MLRMMRDSVGHENAPWLCRAQFAVQLIQYVTCDPVRDHMLPVAEHLRRMAEKAYADEERMRTHPDEADDATVAEVSEEMLNTRTPLKTCFLVPGGCIVSGLIFDHHNSILSILGQLSPCARRIRLLPDPDEVH